MQHNVTPEPKLRAHLLPPIIMSRPLQARINLAALRNNLEVVRRNAPQSRVMAVVKANGYGHGLLRVAEALRLADGFAVLNIGEASVLRDAGFKQPILLLEGFFDVSELSAIANLRLDIVVHSAWQIEALATISVATKIGVFLKLNSGMNRLGFRPAEFGTALDRLRSNAAVRQITLMTHFATADEDAGIGSQMAKFNSVVGSLELPRTLANSAAILRCPESHADWVRPGIMLYGCSPFSGQSAAVSGLKPVMTLASEIIAVQELAVGDKLGYGATFVADHPMRIGVVACGYADGYPRHAPTGTPILVEGQRSCTLGRVSMDMLFADLTEIPGGGVGSVVTLWGESLPVEEVAQAAGTISYELLCALASRVPISDFQI